jgi:hypothetical protein
MFSASEEDPKDCVLCKVFNKGWCKKDFEVGVAGGKGPSRSRPRAGRDDDVLAPLQAFDSCFEEAQKAGKDESVCMDLVRPWLLLAASRRCCPSLWRSSAPPLRLLRPAVRVLPRLHEGQAAGGGRQEEPAVADNSCSSSVS